MRRPFKGTLGPSRTQYWLTLKIKRQWEKKMSERIRQLEQSIEKIQRELDDIKHNLGHREDIIVDCRRPSDMDVHVIVHREVQFRIRASHRSPKLINLIDDIFKIKLLPSGVEDINIRCWDFQFARFIIERNIIGEKNDIRGIDAKYI